MRTNIMPFSIYGIPLIGLAGLLICLWHPQLSLRAETLNPEMVSLAKPSPQFDKIRTTFLRQEAKDVADSRKHKSSLDQAQAIADYNLIAQECTPAVFKATHLPQSMTL